MKKAGRLGIVVVFGALLAMTCTAGWGLEPLDETTMAGIVGGNPNNMDCTNSFEGCPLDCRPSDDGNYDWMWRDSIPFKRCEGTVAGKTCYNSKRVWCGLWWYDNQCPGGPLKNSGKHGCVDACWAQEAPKPPLDPDCK